MTGQSESQPESPANRITRQAATEAVADLGWRYILGELLTYIPVESLTKAVHAATHVVATAGAAAAHVRIDVRGDRLVVSLQTPTVADVTTQDIDLAGRISATMRRQELTTRAGPAPRTVQLVEIAIDAMDIAVIRPFWKVILGYADEAEATGPTDPLIDPLRQGPAIWFQQMNTPRPQRNRIHLDISVPHDEAPRRIRAAVEAGGTLVSDIRAPAFWVLADAEGNEACVTTWQGRD